MAGDHEPGSFQTIRKYQLADGPTGRFVPVVIAAILALAAIAWSAGDPIRFVCVLAVIGLVIYAISHTLRHARENPIKAALYGAEVTQCQHCFGTKSDPRMLPSELVADVVRGLDDDPVTPVASSETSATPVQKPLTLDLPSAPAPEAPTGSTP